MVKGENNVRAQVARLMVLLNIRNTAKKGLLLFCSSLIFLNFGVFCDKKAVKCLYIVWD